MTVGRKQTRTLPMLWLLLAAAIVLPVAALMVGGYFIWEGVVTESERDLRRRADIGVENAARVFETHELILRTLDRVTAGMSDDDVKAHEAELHRQIATLVAGVPQVWDVFIWGADGALLVSGRLYPAPPASVSDREYFVALKEGAPEPYVSALLTGRLNGTPFFNVARRRTGPHHGFNGVIGVSIDPGYFERRWTEVGLADRENGTSMAILRNDGMLLARAPSVSLAQGQASTGFQAALRLGSQAGRYTDISVADGVRRRVFFRRVSHLPLFVSSTVSESALRAALMNAIMPHLWFGLPATVLLAWLITLVMRRTVETEEAIARANAEREARADAEKVIAHAAKLESIGHLAAGLAHDFNNILAATIGGIDLSLRRLRDGRVAAVEPLLAQSLQAARRGAGLTRQLLAFARGVDDPSEAIQPADVIREVASLLPPLLGPSIRIEIDVPNALWPVRASRPMLESALMNLAVNAKDAMPEGGTIRVRAENIARDGPVPPELRRDADWVRIAMRDTGPGFPEEVRVRAFEPFVTTKEVGRGTGLGLAQVYGGARQAGGIARIEDDGRGATVAIYLPRGDTPIAPAPEPKATAAADRQLRVLLVDDDRLVQVTSALSLRDAGHEVLDAESGATALAILRGEPGIDVMVVDYAMPEMNGATLIAEARRLRPSLPVLMVSGQANLDTLDLPQGVGRLFKPFTPDDLVRAVNETIRAAEVTA